MSISPSAKSFRATELCSKPNNLPAEDYKLVISVKPYKCLVCQKQVAAEVFHNHPPVNTRTHCSCGLRHRNTAQHDTS